MFYLTLGFIVMVLIGMTSLIYFDQDEFNKKFEERLEEEGEYDLYYIYK